MNNQDVMISSFKGATTSTPDGEIPLLNVIMSTRAEANKSIEDLRAAIAAGDKAKACEIKEQLPAYTMSGTFEKRRRSDLKAHTGLVVLDYDDVDVDATREALANMSGTLAAWMSPSGTGVKALVPVTPIPTDQHEHVAAWLAVAEAYSNIDGLDPSGKDMTRLCYMSRDKDMYIASDAQSLTPIEWEMTEVPADTHQEPDNDDLGEILAVNPAKDYDYEAWNDVGMALHSGGHPFSLWDEWSARDADRYPGRDALKAKWDGYTSGGGVTMGTFWHHMTRRAGPVKPWGTDSWLAECAIMGMANQILYVHDKDAEHGGRLMIDDGFGRWEHDPGRVSAAYHEQWRIYDSKERKVINTEPNEKKRTAALKKHYNLMTRVNKAVALTDLRKFAPSVVLDREAAGVGTKGLTIADVDEIDANTRYYSCANGIVDLHEGRLLTQQEGRGALVSMAGSPCSFDPSLDPESEPHEYISQMFAAVGDELMEWLIESIGHALRGKPNRRLIMLQGPGNSGKTTLMKILASVIGDGMDAMIRDAVSKDKKKGAAGLSPELEIFTTKRLVYLDEGNSENFDQEMIKSITGGGALPYRGTWATHQTTRPATATPIVAGNEKLKIDYDDHAMMDRLCVVPINTLPESEMIPGFDELLFNECGDELITRLVHAAARNETPPEKPQAILDTLDGITDEFGVNRTALRGWLNSHIVRTDDDHDTCSSQQALIAYAEDTLTNETEKQNALSNTKRRDVWIDMIKKVHGLPPTGRFRVNGVRIWGWKGWKFVACSQCAHIEEDNNG